ncbi:VTT domain-containing protein [Candidatus Woesearchaeota archaeon]|nr:VTT domain-containing protein [Candidatus Woesearchaeota archaeon]
MKKRTRNYALFFILLIFIVFWSALLYFITPQELVEIIGVKNGYILSFLFGVFGEAATLTAISYYPAIITLAAGGLNPFLLGVIAGTGMTIGNSLYFYFGVQGRGIMPERLEKRAERLLEWINKRPRWLVQILIFLYVGFTPFPNNLLTVSGGVAGYPFKRIIVPLLLGNIVLTSSLAYLTALGLRVI